MGCRFNFYEKDPKNSGLNKIISLTEEFSTNVMALNVRDPGSFIKYCSRILPKLFLVHGPNVCSNSNHHVNDLTVEVEDITICFYWLYLKFHTSLSLTIGW